MYNLVIFPDNTNANTTIYNLEPFSTYYGKGTNLNITKYCNTSKKLRLKHIRNYHLNIVIQLMVLILFLRKTNFLQENMKFLQR
jgi:hypothetical protein